MSGERANGGAGLGLEIPCVYLGFVGISDTLIDLKLSAIALLCIECYTI